MKKLALVLSLSLAPAAAHAGFGTTGYLGWGEVFWFDAFGPGGGFVLGAMPSLDYREDPFVLQLHVLEFLEALSDEEVFLGGNFYYAMESRPLRGGWNGVVQPGVSVDLLGDPFILALGGTARFGAETASTVGIGLYVVPTLGIVVDDGEADLLTGGTIQLSFWLASGRGPAVSPAEAPPATPR